MGKPYANELQYFSKTYEWSSKIPLNEFVSFLKNSSKTPLYVIGSGGSFTATTFASILHQQIGMISRCLTPFEFLGYENIGRENSILIITASGRNSDIIASLEQAIKLEPRNLMVLCASTNSPLTHLARKISFVNLLESKLPTGKDGFLATNSLLATVIWILRAYVEAFSLPYEIPTSLADVVHPGISENEFVKQIETSLNKLKSKDTIVILYDNWSKPAAIDAESKLVEGGLANVQLADYRNFAHGRHNWLDKNKNNTGVIALVTQENEKLAKKTLSLFPKNIPTVIFETNVSGPLASIALLVKIMYSVKFFGDFRKIDPGRPGVPLFGRKIYHLKPLKKLPFHIPGLTQNESFAIKRKINHLDLSDDKVVKKTIDNLKNFMQRLEFEKFSAIVLDYDGTLCDPKNRFTGPSKMIGQKLTQLLSSGIIVGVATGRGKSVRNDLQKLIPKKYWKKLFIGYYNCSDIGTLDQNKKPNISAETDPTLQEFLKLITNHNILDETTIPESRPKQISIKPNNVNAIKLISAVQSIDAKKLSSIKILESSHSIDIITSDVSKLNLINEIIQKSTLVSDSKILCIGDKGKWPGNDYELLATEYSLSVDEVSSDPNSCWNLVKPGYRGEQATLSYLDSLIIKNNYFIINSKKICNE